MDILFIVKILALIVVILFGWILALTLFWLSVKFIELLDWLAEKYESNSNNKR